ncbi:uncharacterized protein TRAVEDRAFT_49173 [Trametes versicolor FP-101664 SS1]|uniref:uncharacterized protein n=1 Tax=Trametes versicolor (strain FP-101664) TaxID=717944 RepID=UPI00046214A1|nr:uncharacterized protein TRAVEDRAFT_49173 [Trametes versicolor FP-101664 SS1]EIW56344.1 hypothetical protein TRAVEDRAFT_49173 [Trametes versicolor FP-101664 SS1]
MVLVSQYPITSLSIWDLSIFPSWATLFNFIWSFPELSKLRLGSHLDGLPGKKDVADELTLAKGARLSAIASRGRCSRLRTLELYDIWYLCSNFPPKGVFGDALETLMVKVGERACRAAQSAIQPGFPLLKDFAALRSLTTLEIHLTRYALAPAHETWRHRRMATELQLLVQNMYANKCALKKLRFRFAAPESINDLTLPFNAKLLLDTYFRHLFFGVIRSIPAWRFLRQIEVVLPSNDLPAPCLEADWWTDYLRADDRLPFDGDIGISLSFYRAYSYLDPDKTLPPAWYCIRHRAAVVPTICTEECFKKGPLPYDIAEGFEELGV